MKTTNRLTATAASVATVFLISCSKPKEAAPPPIRGKPAATQARAAPLYVLEKPLNEQEASAFARAVSELSTDESSVVKARRSKRTGLFLAESWIASKVLNGASEELRPWIDGLRANAEPASRRVDLPDDYEEARLRLQLRFAFITQAWVQFGPYASAERELLDAAERESSHPDDPVRTQVAALAWSMAQSSTDAGNRRQAEEIVRRLRQLPAINTELVDQVEKALRPLAATKGRTLPAMMPVER